MSIFTSNISIKNLFSPIWLWGKSKRNTANAPLIDCTSFIVTGDGEYKDVLGNRIGRAKNSAATVLIFGAVNVYANPYNNYAYDGKPYLPPVDGPYQENSNNDRRPDHLLVVSPDSDSTGPGVEYYRKLFCSFFTVEFSPTNTFSKGWYVYQAPKQFNLNFNSSSVVYTVHRTMDWENDGIIDAKCQFTSLMAPNDYVSGISTNRVFTSTINFGRDIQYSIVYGIKRWLLSNTTTSPANPAWVLRAARSDINCSTTYVNAKIIISAGDANAIGTSVIKQQIETAFTNRTFLKSNIVIELIVDNPLITVPSGRANTTLNTGEFCLKEVSATVRTFTKAGL